MVMLLTLPNQVGTLMCFWCPLESALDKDDSHLAIFGSTNLGVIFWGLKLKFLIFLIKMGHFFHNEVVLR
jgi:hypothetical protein